MATANANAPAHTAQRADESPARPASEVTAPQVRRVRLAALPKAKVARVLRRVRGQGPARAVAPNAASQVSAPDPDTARDATPGRTTGGDEAAVDLRPSGNTAAAVTPEHASTPDEATNARATPTPARLEAPEPAPQPQPETAPAAPAVATEHRASIWDALDPFTASSKHLDRQRIVSARREDPAHAAFDLLRTRLLQALADNGWRRVAITSPTARCGKTLTAANLAVSLSRQENCRTVLLDLDLRRPSLHGALGHANPAPIGDMLRGSVEPADHLLRLGENDFDGGHNLALGFNGRRERYAAELMQDPRTAQTLVRIEAELAPDVMLFDLPPALYTDDVMALRPHFDGIILVIGGGITTPKEIKAVERRLGERVPLLGMVLNMAEDSDVRHYPY